jgi:hypothetical protein
MASSCDVSVSVKDAPAVVAALEQATRAIEIRNAALLMWMESLHAAPEDWRTCTAERCVQTRAALEADGKS